MKLELAEKIVRLANDLRWSDDGDIVYVQEYIPRYCTEKTYGIDGLTPAQLIKILIENADDFVYNDCSMFENINEIHIDSIGLSYIIY